MANTKDIAGNGQAAKKEGEDQEAAKMNADIEQLMQRRKEVLEHLEQIKVKNLHKMVDSVATGVQDSRTEVQCLYLTNAQATAISIETMPAVRRQLKIDVPEAGQESVRQEPKMVIRLMPCRGKTYFEKTFQNYNTEDPDRDSKDRRRIGRFPHKAVPELTDEDEDTSEHQLLLLAKKVLLPLASRTNSLVIGSESCSLTAAFVQVSAPIQRELGDRCPFSLLIFARAYFYELATRPAPGKEKAPPSTVAAEVKANCSGWREEDSRVRIGCVLKHAYGEDEAFWPREDLPTGKYSLVAFECAAPDGSGDYILAEEVYDKFTNDFITSMSEQVPVVALQTYGTNKMSTLPAIADHISRGMQLVLLDSRVRPEVPSFQPPPSLDDARLQLERFSRSLHEQTGRLDQYFVSAISFVRKTLDAIMRELPEEQSEKAPDTCSSEDLADRLAAVLRPHGYKKSEVQPLNPKRGLTMQPLDQPRRTSWCCCCRRRVEEPDDRRKERERRKLMEDQRRTDADMYIWEAICKRKHFAVKTPKGGESMQAYAQKEWNRRMIQVKEAANIIMNYAAEELEWEAKELKRRAEVAIEQLSDKAAIRTWEDFAKCLKKNWCALRGYSFHHFADVYNFAKTHDQWIEISRSNRHTHEGSLVLKIKNPDTLAPGLDLRKAQSDFRQLLLDSIQVCHDYDRRTKYKEAFCRNQDMWAAIYDIFMASSDIVHTASIHNLDDVKQTIESIAQVDRLPKKNSLEALVLLRTAWNMVDVYNASAQSYKRLSRLTYFLMLAVGLATVVFTAVCNIFPDVLDRRNQSHVLLALSLVAAGLTGYIALVDPTRKWLQLRNSAYRMESEIWRFRTRCGVYQAHTQSVSGRKDDERRAEAALQGRILQIQGHVQLSTGLRDTSFYSISMTTHDDAPLYQTKPRCCRRILRKLCCRREERENLTSLHFQHGQYRRGDRCTKPREGRDSFHAPASPEEYIKWRLLPRIRFFERRIPGYARWRRAFQVLLLMCALASSLLAAMNYMTHTSIIAAASSAVASAQEFLDVARKLQRYSTTVGALNDIVAKWYTLSDVEQANSDIVNHLVVDSENLLDEERGAWMSEPQSAPRLGRASDGDGQKTAEDKKK